MEELQKEYLEKLPPAGNFRGYLGRIHEDILVANQIRFQRPANQILEAILEELEEFLDESLIELLAESFE